MVRGNGRLGVKGHLKSDDHLLGDASDIICSWMGHAPQKNLFSVKLDLNSLQNNGTGTLGLVEFKILWMKIQKYLVKKILSNYLMYLFKLTENA